LILDTNALSAFADGEPGVGEILRRQQRAALPVIVLGEFRYGIAGSRYRKDYEEWLSTHLSGFELLPITAETTIPYAILRGTLRRLGRPIPANDAWIAALAIQHGLPILSRDEHFDALPDLRRIKW
jgi:predicted nucleic acid-binding protein